ncbi:MAG TPA: response regulator transcription factor [Dermatophilaceae bacterium]|nr:response regulator transcription factor [Dermatophilaceae bacterium]
MADQRRILVVEDEPAIAAMARLYLQRSGYAVSVADTAAAARVELQEEPADVVLLDINLPGGEDGLDLCRSMRAAQDWTPVIFVSARDEEVDRVVGLELGADDYVTKPYSPRELVARVRAVLRRHDRADAPGSGADHGRGVRQVGRVRLDPERRRVFVDQVEVSLTSTEFDLLAQLMSRPGRVYPRGELLHLVWGYPSDDGSRTVDVHVAQLRGKLGPASPIRTVRGVGYSVEARA